MSIQDIRRTIQAIAEQGVGNTDNMIFEAEVVSVGDETITIETEGMRLTDVRTCASTDGCDDYMRIYPSVGSTVVCLDASGSRRDIIVIQYSSIDKVSIHKGEHTSVYGDELKEQLDILSDRVQAIYDALNNSATGSQDGGAVFKSQIMARLAQQSKKEYFGNIEDETLLH